MRDFDVIVVGGGHAGCEAASTSARMGCSTALVTLKIDALGRMSCNPAIGGIAKGQIVKEIDALGGEMGVIADKTALHFRMLGRSKGPAMWSPRAQCDRQVYNDKMVERMKSIPGLILIEDEAIGIGVKNGHATEIILKNEGRASARAIILAAGTFLEGKIFTGKDNRSAGRWGEPPSEGLSGALVRLGFEKMRLKTGTPPRLVGDSIDYDKLTPQPGDEDIHYFSFRTEKPENPPDQLLCWQAYTNENTHKLIDEHLWEAPLYDGTIEAVGPRYCPSIETKVVKFPDRNKHLLFVEPEGWDNPLVYLNGFSTSIPAHVQEKAVRTIAGFEHAEIARPGYAIEYDAFPPHQVDYTLETRLIEGLYFVGQILGTSGYEEAGGLGLLAGINAVLKIRGEKPYILDRSQAYIGVMVDDLIIRGAPEPYRMFTSRAEYRLLLRSDNADERLSKDAHRLGLLNENEYKIVKNRYDKVDRLLDILHKIRINYDGGNFSGFELLKRPELKIDDIMDLLPDTSLNGKYSEDIRKLVEIRVKYEGYIQRQQMDVERFRSFESKSIPDNLDYDTISSISYEGRQQLKRIRPPSLGAASRIFGVTPADIAVLAIALKKRAFHVEQ